jgi:hypothetical protein
MPVAFVAEIPGMTADIYDQVMQNMGWGRDTVPDGMISHYACQMPDGLFFFDVWDTADDWKRFAEERLGPAMDAATGGQGAPPEPRFYPIHREEHR